MKNWRRNISGLILTAFVAGCSGGDPLDDGSILTGATSAIREKFKSRQERGGSGADRNIDIATTLTRAQIESLNAPTLAGFIPSRNAWSSLSQVAENGSNKTYFTPDYIGVTVNRGILVSTRGITGDLYASSPNATLRAIYGPGSGSYTKTLRYLTATSKYLDFRFECSVRSTGHDVITIAQRSHRTRTFEESCRHDDHEFTNRYWIDSGSNAIIRSHQWVSPALGYLDLYKLK